MAKKSLVPAAVWGSEGRGLALLHRRYREKCESREGFAMVSHELMEILRCPHCVSGPSRGEGSDPGRLELVKDAWLVCTEPGCGRKYPIRDGIPVMLVEEGDRWRHTGLDTLPVPPPAD